MVLMDEQKKDEPGTNVTELTVVKSEILAGGNEAVVESMDYEGEEGGSCNGDDIMVELLDSHVYVDGICTTDGGGKKFGGDDTNNKAAMNVENLKDQQNFSEEKVHRDNEHGQGDAKTHVAAEWKTMIEEVFCFLDKGNNRDAKFSSQQLRTEECFDKGVVPALSAQVDVGTLIESLVEKAVTNNQKLGNYQEEPVEKIGGVKDTSMDSDRDVELRVEDYDSDFEIASRIADKLTAKEQWISGMVQRANYELSMEDEGESFLSDLVWSKLRGHLWWPGQIIDPSDASKKAMEYHKKDSFLVAYFGDRTFAWNEASSLMPFRKHFSQIEKQSSLETCLPDSEKFRNAIDCALEEVSRRVELGLSCSCIPKDVYEKIRCQIIENAGIQDSLKDRNSMSLSPCSFESIKFLEYVKALAESPMVGADRLDLAIAKSQMFAFYRLQDYFPLPAFQFSGSLQKANGVLTSSSSSKKRKAADSLTVEGKKTSSGGSEEQPSQKRQYRVVPVELRTPIKNTPITINHDLVKEKPPGDIIENPPAEIVMSFFTANSVPSETKLNQMFKHFGRLKESETEVDHKTSRARVVFKKCSEAKTAFDSARKFNIFGSKDVKFQLNYVISESFKASVTSPTLAEETHSFPTTNDEHTPLISSTADEESHLISPNFGEEELFATTNDEHTPLISSTADEGSNLISPNFGDEESFMASHFDNDPLSMPAPITEETLHLATSLGEGNFHIVTSLYEETLPSIPTLGREPMDLCEDNSTSPTGVGEESSTAAPTEAEELSIDVDKGTANVATTVCEENSTAAGNVGGKTAITAVKEEKHFTDYSTLVEKDASAANSSVEDTPTSKITSNEEPSTAAATAVDDEGPTVMTTEKLSPLKFPFTVISHTEMQRDYCLFPELLSLHGDFRC